MVYTYLNIPIFRLENTPGKYDFQSDAIIIDLEDGIHTNKKQQARALLGSLNLDTIECKIGIRINAINSIDGIKDIEGVYDILKSKKINISFIQIPKVKTIADVKLLSDIFFGFNLDLIPIIETIEGVNNMQEIASISDAMMFGQVDFINSLYSPNILLNSVSRANFCSICSLYGIPAIDTAVFVNKDSIYNLDEFRKECIKSKNEGFVSKAVVHPDQVLIAKDVYQFKIEEIEHYKNIIQSYYNSDQGFSILNDVIIAPPFVSHAKMILNLLKIKY